MVVFNLRCFRKFSLALICSRPQKYTTSIQNINYFSSEKIASGESPVKFTKSKASKITISDMIDPPKRKPGVWYERYVIILSLAVFYTYFFVLREGNQIDEILKGNYENEPTTELVMLKNQLKYCEVKKLPTTALRNKIERLEAEINLKKLQVVSV